MPSSSPTLSKNSGAPPGWMLLQMMPGCGRIIEGQESMQH
jgi:hypothetical protein